MSIVRIAYFFTGVGEIFHENVNLLYEAEYKVVPSQSSVCRKISARNMFQFVTVRETTISCDELGKRSIFYLGKYVVCVAFLCAICIVKNLPICEGVSSSKLGYVL